MSNATYIIPECNLPALQEKIDKLNKRAVKLGTVPITLTSTPAYVTHEYTNSRGNETSWACDHEITWKAGEDGTFSKEVGAPCAVKVPKGERLTGRVMPWLSVVVTGEAPKYDGWSLLGVLEPLTSEDGTVNVVKTVPGHTVPEKYRSLVGHCDHCDKIRKRSATFVVQHEGGTTACVGRACLKDFLGHADPKQLASWAEVLMELGTTCRSMESETGPRVESQWSLVTFLEVVGVLSDQGYVSRARAEETGRSSTASLAMGILTTTSSSHPDAIKWAKETRDNVTERHTREAEAAIGWLSGLASTDSDYLWNLQVIAKAGYVSHKTTGLAGSMLQAWRRATGVPLERPATKPSQHVGKVGDKIECDVTCNRVYTTEGMYGTTGIHNMTDEDGNVLVWFATGSTTWLTEGSKFRIKGTITRHNDYKGQNQTALTRVKILRDYTEEAYFQAHEKTTT